MDTKVRNPNEEVKAVIEQAEPLMTPQQVADYLRMPVATLQTWRAQRTGPRGYRVGKHVRYRSEDVERWLAQRADRREETAP